MIRAPINTISVNTRYVNQWLISAKKHSSNYRDTLVALDLWKKSCENSFKYKNKYLKKIILIKFDDLINNTELTMRKISLGININFEESLLLPTFNDPKDRIVIKIFKKEFNNRKIIPIDCSELIWGFGAIHCLTQQEPK